MRLAFFAYHIIFECGRCCLYQLLIVFVLLYRNSLNEYTSFVKVILLLMNYWLIQSLDIMSKNPMCIVAKKKKLLSVGNFPFFYICGFFFKKIKMQFLICFLYEMATF